MAEPFKNLLHAGLVQHAAQQLLRISPRFDAARFEQMASSGLDTLELKARAHHICAALEATLPDDFAAAADLVEAVLAPPVGVPGEQGPDEGPQPAHDPQDPQDPQDLQAGPAPGLKGWILWPVGEFIARRGQHQPARALAALHALTQRFTAEFAIRPFIIHHPDLSFSTLHGWVHDDSAHVRRLVSEGSRPRLPWGQQIRALIDDPSPTLPLLQALQDDPSAYVRRSVANHLNDIAKDHPARVAHWLQQHLPQAPAPRKALLRHASRTLIKAGDPAVLKAWGLGAAFKGQAALKVLPRRIDLGDAVQMQLSLQSTSARSQTLAIDYAVHHVKADGSTRPKVFKGWQLQLPPHGQVDLVKRHAVRPITTRRYHAGQHGVAVQINGQVVAEAHFMLRLPGNTSDG